LRRPSCSSARAAGLITTAVQGSRRNHAAERDRVRGVVVQRPRRTRPWVNKPWLNAIAGVIVAAMLVLSLILVVST